MSQSRFDLENVIADKDLAFIQANLIKLKELSTSVYVIPPSQTHRLDLISYTIYGTVNMKHYLMYVNDLIDLSVLEFGYKLKYPALKDILMIINETKDFK
jgi:hypothetical protein